MGKQWKIFLLLCATAMLLCGCALRTVDELYCLPKRSNDYDNLQAVIDKAMNGLEYATPAYGDHRLVVQPADLDGDGVDEYMIFAKDNSEKPLKILIFCQLASGYVLMDTIEGYGFAFDFVEYVQLDDRPGVEIVVGRRLSDQVARSICVYRFSNGFSRQMLNAGYARMTTCDLDRDGVSELFLLNHGESEDSNGMVSLYRYADGELQRSAQLSISASAANFKRINASKLSDGTPAVFITSAASEKELVTDVFSAKDGQLLVIKKGIAVETLNNYYIYPTDINSDGILEIPQLLPMFMPDGSQNQRYLLQWDQINAQAVHKPVRYTYHDTEDNWYLRLEDDWVETLHVEQQGNTSVFSIYEDGELIELFSILELRDADRLEQSTQEGRIVLYSSDSVIYVAQLDPVAVNYGITEENLAVCFTPVRVDMNTEEEK